MNHSGLLLIFYFLESVSPVLVNKAGEVLDGCIMVVYVY